MSEQIKKMEIFHTEISNLSEDIMQKINSNYKSNYTYIYSFLQKNLQDIVNLEDLIKTNTIFNMDLNSQLQQILTHLKNISTNISNQNANTYINQLKPIIASLKTSLDNFQFINSDRNSYDVESLDAISKYQFYQVGEALKTLNDHVAKSKFRIESNDKLFDSLIKDIRDKQNELTSDIEKMNENFKQTRELLVDNATEEFNNTNSDLKNLLNLTSMDAHAKNHMDMSKKFKCSSIVWLIIVIAFLILSSLVSIKLFVNVKNFLPESNIWVNLALKTLLLLPIYSFTLFAMKQMNSYDELYVNSLHIATEIAVINNYIDGLNDKEIIKSDLAYKYFGNKHNTKFKNANNLPMDIIKNISRLPKNDLELLISNLTLLASKNNANPNTNSVKPEHDVK